MSATRLLGVFLDHTVGNVLRMLRVIRLPRQERGRLSWDFIGTLCIVMIYGLVMLFSASYPSGYHRYNGNIYHFIIPQTIVAVLGMAMALLLISNINYRALRHITEPLYLVTLILLVMVLFMPTDVDGFHRWFKVGSLSFQPSEIAKFAVILWVADYADRHYQQKSTLLHGIIGPVSLVVPVLVLLLFEPHKSATMIVVLIVATMLACGGCGLKWFPTVGAAGIAALWYYISHAQDYAQQRLGGVWGLTPTDTANMDWQTKQGLYAISSGGLFGLGIGNSRQKQLWLPYAENDFIFSIVCEELGFVGAVLLIFLFALLIYQGVAIALRAPDYFGSLLGLGIVAQVAWQVFCHIGVNAALLPNTGISLPFFSSGGTSLLMLLAEMGVLMSISRAGNARADAMEQRRQAEFARRMGSSRVYRRRTDN
ncbi:MAG: FtsW/RodA/SpoVE family cell cycle protein [Gemmiger sp.]